MRSLKLSRLDVRGSQSQQDARVVKADPVLMQFLMARPAQIEQYIQNNVTDLASARAVLKTLAKAVALLAKREFERPAR